MSLCRAFLRVKRSCQTLSVQETCLRKCTPSVCCTPRGIRSTSTLKDHSPGGVESLCKTIHAFAQSDNLATIRQNYDNLVKELGKSNASTVPRALTRDQVEDVLRSLGRSGRPSHLMLATTILADLPDVLGLERNVDLHTVVVKALIEHGNLVSARHWLVTMRQKPGQLLPTHSQWHLLLEGHAAQGDIISIFKCLSRMPRSGIKPTHESFDIVWSILVSASAPPWHFHSAIKAIHKADLPYRARISDLLYEHFSRRNESREAVWLQKLYRAPFDGDNSVSSLQPHWRPNTSLVQQISEMVEKIGEKAALEQFETLPQYKGMSKETAMMTLLRNSTSVDALRSIEGQLDFRAGVKPWSLLINNCLHAGKPMDACTVLIESQKAGISPDAPMVHPIISALCQTATEQPSEDNIDMALHIYQQLPRTGPRSARPDGAIYNALLRALSSAPSVTKYYPVALSLVRDMESLKIAKDQPMTTASLASIVMRHSNSYPEAFHAYRVACEDGVAPLDKKGFVFILNVFSKLSPGSDETIPPLDLYFEIVKDMRNAGYGSGLTDVYTILWRRLTYLATHGPKNREFRRELITTIRQTHQHLNLDASLTPDTITWNFLMDAYQRAGCLEDAYKIWDMLYLTGTIDNVSVDIILDACGHARLMDVAESIWSKLHVDNFPLTRNNFLTWVECLCRSGKLDEAVDTVCANLEKFAGAHAEAVRILLTFAEKGSLQSKVKAHLARCLPHVSGRSFAEQIV